MSFSRIPVRLRLSLGHSFLMLLLFGLLGFGLYKIVEGNLRSSVDGALLASARSARDVRVEAIKYNRYRDSHLLRNLFDNPLLVERMTGQRVVRPYAQMIDVSGRVYSKTANFNVVLPLTDVSLVRAELGKATFENFQVGGAAPMRQVTLPVVLNGRFTGELVQVGTSLAHLQETLRSTMFLLQLVLPVAFIFSILLGYFLTARVLRPVNHITKAASGLGIDDLSIRLPIPAAKDELRELSRTFNEMLDRLEVAVTKLRRFSGDVSHELRTPLAVLRGEAELALRRERTPAEYSKALSTILDESLHMTTITEDLLLFARAESGVLKMSMENIKLETFLTEIKVVVSSVFREQRVQLEVEHEEICDLWGSKTYMLLAVKNVLINAAKHSSEGGKVLLRVFTRSGMTVLSVKDWGVGISVAALPHVFDPFFRADHSRTRSSGGVGLGLTLAAALVKLHSGMIDVASDLGQGSRFELMIPSRAEVIEGHG